MACHEIAALRLALMNVLGGDREGERQHELAELGKALETEPVIANLARARNFAEIKVRFEDAIVELEQRQAALPKGDAKREYLRALVLVVKSAEQSLRRIHDEVEQFYRGLEEIHDLVHELYPPVG